MKNIQLVATIYLLIVFSSCKTQNILLQTKSVQASSFQKLDTTFNTNLNYEYHIRKDDKLNVSIWNNDDISVGSVYGIYNSNEGYGKWLLVDNEGEVSLPQIGAIKVEGLTIVELKHMLYDSLSKTILNPVIDIKVLNKDVTVLGEVKIPGKHLLEKDNTTLLDVLGLAGDFDTYANKEKIQVIRSENTQTKVKIVDLVNAHDFTSANIVIHPGDVVYVPSKKGKDWDKRAGSTLIPLGSAITTLILILKFI